MVLRKGKAKPVKSTSKQWERIKLHSTKRILTATPTIYSQTRKWEECTKKVPREETEKHINIREQGTLIREQPSCAKMAWSRVFLKKLYRNNFCSTEQGNHSCRRWEALYQ